MSSAAQGQEMVNAAVCPLCGGTGWKHLPPAEGKKTPQVVRCDCRKGTRADTLLSRARIPARYEHCAFDSFHTERHPSLQKAKIVATKYVENFALDRDRTGLTLVGPIGVGKTHLAVAMVRDLIARGVECLFYDYRELLKEIQNSYNPQVNTTELAILRPIFEAEVLVLDELGAVKPTEWVWDTVSHILNTRYNTKRTTIVTTNYKDLPPPEFGSRNSALASAERVAKDPTLGERIGERMRSRLHEMCRFIELDGSDFRQGSGSATVKARADGI